jgi:hypothetical protein
MQTEMFKTFIRENYPNARTSGDWNTLLVQLNLDGYDDISTASGANVGKIIRDKVKNKLYSTEKKMSEDGEIFGR